MRGQALASPQESSSGAPLGAYSSDSTYPYAFGRSYVSLEAAGPKPVHVLCGRLVGLLAVFVVATSLVAVGGLIRVRAIDAYLDDPGEAAFEGLQARDTFSAVTGGLYALVFLATAVVFIVWLWRARGPQCLPPGLPAVPPAVGDLAMARINARRRPTGAVQDLLPDTERHG